MYRDQSAADLRLHVVEGEIDVRRFTVFESATLGVGGLRVEAGIIGASHYVGWAGYGATRCPAVTELFACDAVEDKHLVYAADLAALPRPLSLGLGGGVAYRFEHRVTDMTTSARSVEDLRSKIVAASDPDTLGLARAFPGLVGEAAETLVWARTGADGRSLSIETAHSYPNEGSVVLSRSTVALTPLGPRTGVG